MKKEKQARRESSAGKDKKQTKSRVVPAAETGPGKSPMTGHLPSPKAQAALKGFRHRVALAKAAFEGMTLLGATENEKIRIALMRRDVEPLIDAGESLIEYLEPKPGLAAPPCDPAGPLGNFQRFIELESAIERASAVLVLCAHKLESEIEELGCEGAAAVASGVVILCDDARHGLTRNFELCCEEFRQMSGGAR